jgi:hypothetical protein
MQETLKTEILHKSMWNMYSVMKNDNFTFEGYRAIQKIEMIQHILPYFSNIEEYEICSELTKEIEKIKSYKYLTL